MNDFIRSNKVTGIYWIKNPINKLKVKVQLKPQTGIISLPKFEEYANEGNKTSLNLEHNVEEYVFNWQEKKFSAWEIHKYKDNRNCVTDNELAYHNMTKNLEQTSHKIFSYIHDDNYISLPFQMKKTSDSLCLNSILEHLRLDKKVHKFRGYSNRSGSAMHIFNIDEKIFDDDEQWIAMHIVFDNSGYDEFSKLIIKQEVVLISLYYNSKYNYLMVSPDKNNLEFNPYILMTDNGIHLQYHYDVNISFDDDYNHHELMILLRKLYKKWEKRQKNLVNFVMPPHGVKIYYLALEIITADGFEMDNLYIEYHVTVPEGVICTDSLQGNTQTSKCIRVNQTDQCNFGHTLQLELQVNTDIDPPPSIKIFFEVISVDWWCRYRTEGYSYIGVSLVPGCYGKQLSCSRPQEMDIVEAESRRFFVGGCHLIKDLEMLAKSQLMNANFTYHTTGFINLRWNIISQSPTPGSYVEPSNTGTSTASALLHGAEAALRKYSKARAKLVAATKDLEVACCLEN